MPPQSLRRFLRPALACLALTTLGSLPAAGAEWSRSVTVYPEVLATLGSGGPVSPLPPRRGPQPGASVEYRWELLAELGPAPHAAGPWGAGSTFLAGSADGFGKAPPALIRPGQAPQWVVGTGVR